MVNRNGVLGNASTLDPVQRIRAPTKILEGPYFWPAPAAAPGWGIPRAGQHFPLAPAAQGDEARVVRRGNQRICSFNSRKMRSAVAEDAG